MTPTMTLTEPLLITGGAPRLSPSFLMSVVVAVLAPLFLGVTGGDPALARMAAVETIDDLRARNQMDLIAVVQIITNGLAAADSLCRSMGDELPLSMTLRLRGNAIGLNRAAEQNRRVLREKRDAGPVLFSPASVPEPEPPVPFAESDTSPEQEGPLEQGGSTDQDGSPEFEMSMNDAAVRLLADEAEARLLHPAEMARALAERRVRNPVPAEHAAPVVTLAKGDGAIRRMRVKAMLKESGGLTDSLRTLPPAERRQAEVRIATLGRLVRDVLTGDPATEAMDDPGRDDAVAGDFRFIASSAADTARPATP